MKQFVLDSTYKAAVIVTLNDEFCTTPAHILPNNPVSRYEVSSNELSNSYISHTSKNDNFNKYNFIDYI